MYRGVVNVDDSGNRVGEWEWGRVVRMGLASGDRMKEGGIG